jgi:hypothetical protein
VTAGRGSGDVRSACDGVWPRACDDSSDCAKGEVCCLEEESGGALLLCKPLGKSSWNDCAVAEACRPEAACVTPGTRCEDFTCQGTRPKKKIACGAATCDDSARICCLPPTHTACGVPAKCADHPNDCYLHAQYLECLEPKHCPAHQSCTTYVDGSTFCEVGSPQGAIVCASNADCHRLRASGKRCRQAPDQPYKICT